MRDWSNNAAWTIKFVAQQREYAAMARRIGETKLAEDFEAIAEKAMTR